MLFFELYKIMVNKVTFVGFRGAFPPPPWIRPWSDVYTSVNYTELLKDLHVCWLVADKFVTKLVFANLNQMGNKRYGKKRK